MKEMVRIRTALDTTLSAQAHFDLTHKSVMQIDWKESAQDVYEFIQSNSSEQFWQQFKALFQFKNKEGKE